VLNLHMNKLKLTTATTEIKGDTLTPVTIYLKIRDIFPHSLLLESTDYQPGSNCYTYICFGPLADFQIADKEILTRLCDGTRTQARISPELSAVEAFEQFTNRFEVETNLKDLACLNGFFGYISYDAVPYFEDIEFNSRKAPACSIPEIHYSVFQFVLAINHHKNEMHLLENTVEGLSPNFPIKTVPELIDRILRSREEKYTFRRTGSELSLTTDQEHRLRISTAKEHIHRGDIFQIVLSRRFEQKFQGDEFNVYRALRNINPSPYLFYFDYGDFRLFGSSPEAQLIVDGNRASLFPIAGTCPRTGDEEQNTRLIKALQEDEKENSEHVMLVDLARNDLSKHCRSVTVAKFKQVQSYSHVIHLCSEVQGILNSSTTPFQLLADTFPAGTLSGAPKHRAMQLIDHLEGKARGFYGGAIGAISFNGDCNHAIMIRSFLSKNGVLYRQAGGGIVADSDPELEVQEVNNKLGALKASLQKAEEF